MESFCIPSLTTEETEIPNSQVHARLGEILYIIAMNDVEENQVETLSEGTRRFCRCIELCNDYLRGCYGLKKVGSSSV